MSDTVILVFDLFSIRKPRSSKLVVCFGACAQRYWRVKQSYTSPSVDVIFKIVHYLQCTDFEANKYYSDTNHFSLKIMIK